MVVSSVGGSISYRYKTVWIFLGSSVLGFHRAESAWILFHGLFDDLFRIELGLSVGGDRLLGGHLGDWELLNIAVGGT